MNLVMVGVNMNAAWSHAILLILKKKKNLAQRFYYGAYVM
jgi:hypothetical protein